MAATLRSEQDGLFEDANAASGPPRHRGPAWLFSLILHAGIFLVIGLCGSGRASLGTGEPDRSVGIAIVQQAADQVRYFSEADSSLSEPDQSPIRGTEGAAASPFPTLDQLPVGLAASLPSRADAARVAGSGTPSLPGADSLAQATNSSRTGVPKRSTSTQVFGVKGTGGRFVYVFDRSASMEWFGGRPIRAAKLELLRSLTDLSDLDQFLIIFYNEMPTVFNPDHPLPPKLLFATKSNKRAAEEFVSQISPAGGTQHLDAIRLALNVQPDVIFLLTDADDPKLSPVELASIRRRNQGGTAINTIEFGTRPAPEPNNFMMQLAEQNDGQHAYVQVSRLP